MTSQITKYRRIDLSDCCSRCMVFARLMHKNNTSRDCDRRGNNNNNNNKKNYDDDDSDDEDDDDDYKSQVTI